MPSIVSAFEYDIFISYRHNDNLDSWVTEFVQNLEKELKATIKDNLSIYFDKNTHDGLLETHSVDKSLEGKLKCLIFIPIISQTYCDTKSFAWQHEFVAFNNLAKGDQFGRDIKLSNGNVGSRILPIKIHDLDVDDKTLLENELGGVLRSIDFIYKEPGVNRPLKLNDTKTDNQNKTDYRNQVNKVANATKELILGIQGRSHSPLRAPFIEKQIVATSYRRKLAIAGILIGLLSLCVFVLYYFGGVRNWLAQKPEKSIAVLPFDNMNHDPEQDYFSNGITEDILNHLVKIADLKVKSRTSTLQYKGTKKNMIEVGEELGVENIVEGSVRLVGNQVRIVVQLIDTETDTHLWSETYDREFKDVLALQSEIAIAIANALEAKLTLVEKQNINKEASQNISAYDYYLKAKEIGRKPNLTRDDFERGFQLLNQAIKLDPEFSRAYAFKGLAWFYTRFFGVSQNIWQDSAIFYSSKAIAIDPNSPDGYLVQARVYEVLGDRKKTKEVIYKAYTLAPNDPDVLDAYGYLLLVERDEKGADLVLKALEAKNSTKDAGYYLWLGDIYRDMGEFDASEKMFQKAKQINPEAMFPYWRLAGLYNITRQYEKGIQEAEQAEKITSKNSEFGLLNAPGVIDILGWLHFKNDNLEKAAEYWSKYPEVEAQFDDSTQFVPYRHNLALVYSRMGRKKEADALIAEDLKKQREIRSGKRSMGVWEGLGAIYYDMAVDHAYQGNQDQAVQYLDSAIQQNFYFPGFHDDPLLDNLRNRDDFKKLIKKVDGYHEFRKQAFSKALNRWQASNELKSILK